MGRAIDVLGPIVLVAGLLVLGLLVTACSDRAERVRPPSNVPFDYCGAVGLRC